MLKTVIFDLDGTLIDSMGVWQQVDREFLKKRNFSVPANLFSDLKVGNSYLETAVYFKERFNLPESPQEIMNEWTQMTKKHYAETIELKKGALDCLEFLKAKSVKIGLGTSNSAELSLTVLKKNRIEHFFDAMAFGDEGLSGKPYPDIFLKVLQRLKGEPQSTIVIEDTLAGVTAAKNAGLKSICLYDFHSRQYKPEIMQLTAAYLYDFPSIIAYLAHELDSSQSATEADSPQANSSKIG